jgi:3-phenylpropionate/cinnamic acid dioxygenase small subunit
MMLAPASSAELLTEVSAFLSKEAKLLDDAKIREWHALFSDICHYWVPIDETLPRSKSASIINDDALALEERVYHVLETHFAAQTPKSRTLHFISNVLVEASNEPDLVTVHSNQLIFELRTGDYRQVGLGDLRPIPTSMTHDLVKEADTFRIRRKIVYLIDREMPQSNLTFLL